MEAKLSENFGLEVGEPLNVNRAVARLEYESTGTLAASIPDAVVLKINGKEAARLAVPQELGAWSERFDLLPYIVDGANNFELEVWTYELDVFGGKVSTNASVRIWVGPRRIFSESYSTREGSRQSTDKLLVPIN
jgi:hypothetical protein